MSISGHKLYGPKGIGALFVRRRPRVRLDPIQTGGGQERNIRSGTVPTPLVVGLGAAAEIALKELEVLRSTRKHRNDSNFLLCFQYDKKRIEKLSKRLVDGICRQLTHVVFNGDNQSHYAGCVNLSFAYIEGESLLMALKDVALSSGR